MKLTLRLAGRDSQTGQSRTLTQGRLSIGRGVDNDWVLADPDRTMSKNHCRIDASGNGFMLTDLSTNGVFLAGHSQAIGRGHSCALESGDSFSLGPYVMRAEIEGEEAETLALEQGIGLPHEDEGAGFSQAGFSQAGYPQANGEARVGGNSPIAPAIEEPWLAGIPGGQFGPNRRAAPQGWDAPPDPASFAASGAFEARDPLEAPARDSSVPADRFSQFSEHVAAPSTVMRLPQPQVVLPTDWNEAALEEQADVPPAHATPSQAAITHAEPAWPPVLPTEVHPQPKPILSPEWMVSSPDEAWSRPAPPAPLPASWITPQSQTDDLSTMEDGALVLAEHAPDVAASRGPVVTSAHAAVEELPSTEPIQAVLSPAKAVGADLASHSGAAERLIAAFLDGAGVSPDTLRGVGSEASFREIGLMVRAAVDGVRDILATRALVKSEFRVDQTVLRRSENNAMKFAPDAERCLAAMIGEAPPGFLPGHDAMRQSMDDIKLHELALVAAINTVFADLGRQLDPEAIIAKAKQETGLGTMLPYAREVRCWAIYMETHAMLQDSGAPNTAGSLLAPVAQAYERQLKRGG